MSYIDKQATIDAIYEKANEELAYANHHFLAGVHMATAVVRDMPERQWIPCSERLPEEDVEVLISYRYKDGEGDTSHVDIDITTYGQMYFGGNKVGNRKHWRAPFEYFESNYEVIAWMPLPEPYSERRQE